MSDIIPPSEPGKEPAQPVPSRNYYQSEPLSKKACAGLGFLLFVFSCLFSMLIPPFFILGFFAAFASLFFSDYRCIFVGFILPIGVLLLAVTIYCSSHPLNL